MIQPEIAQAQYAAWHAHLNQCRACGGADNDSELCSQGRGLLDDALGIAGLDTDPNLPVVPSALSNVPQPGPTCQHRACDSAYAGPDLEEPTA